MRWYSILMNNGIFIGVTSELEVVRWFKRKFKDVIKVEDLGDSEEVAMRYLRNQIGQISGAADEYYMLTMCSCNGISRPMFVEFDETAEEFALDWLVEDTLNNFRKLLACLPFFLNQFLGDKGKVLVQLFSFIYDNIVMPWHSGVSIYQYINKELLIMQFIEEEGELEYYGGV